MSDAASSLKFGTSGLRGLAVDLEGQAARRYCAAFLRHLEQSGQAGHKRVYLGRDFRPSSPAVLNDCAIAIESAGLEPVDCGTLPTPALALYAMASGSPSVMITGSHIPADRNGLKFYMAAGEISKSDEAGILACLTPDDLADRVVTPVNEAAAAAERYTARYLDLLPPRALKGMRIGVFEHSTVARDLLGKIIGHFGAELVSLGRIEGFVPVDTEAFSDKVFEPLPNWIREHELDAVVSADGDGDRPLLMDGKATFVRGDTLGLIAARFLGAQTVVTPVTSNSAIEKTGFFRRVIRTRVGSPYVVADLAGVEDGVVGFEANGGTFIGQGVRVGSEPLPPLETRDAVLPLLCALGAAAASGQSIAQMVGELPLHQALADRIQDVPGARSAAFLNRLVDDRDYVAQLFAAHGVADIFHIDGVQVFTGAGDMVHFRASGNAPEMRCYVESQSAQKAQLLLDWAMATAARELDR